MVREKISFLFLLIVFYVNAAEIYNDGQSSELSWFKHWRKPIANHQDSNNQIILSISTPALPKYEEPSSTTAPARLEIIKTNSHIIAPEIHEVSSVRPSPVSTAEESIVEVKPRRRTFNFGIQEGSYTTTATASPTIISWVPESVKSEPPASTIASSDLKTTVKPFTTTPIPPTIVEHQTKPRYRTFNFGLTETSNTQTESPKKLSSVISVTTPETIVNPSPSQITTIPEVPPSTENYISAPILTTTGLLKNGFTATELEMATQPAPIENSSGFISYRYEEPIKRTTLMSQKAIESSYVQQEYKCNVKNGYYEVVSNCDKFVECKNNVLKLFKCPNELHFNRKSVWPSDPCVEPLVAKCNEIEIEHKPAKFSAILIAHNINFICPSKNGYYRLENDCEKFIKCEEQIPSSYKCSPGLKFNSYAAWGHDPCSDEITCKTVIVRPNPEVKFSAIFVKTLPIYSCPKSEGYFISEKDCDQFIKCEKSIASLYKCASGLQFNRYATWIHDPCELESVVGCKAVAVAEGQLGPKISATLILARVDGYSCPAANGYLRFENDCEKFIKCENSIASSYKCNPGLQFNTYALWGADPCVSSELVRCKTVIILPPLIPKLSAKLITKVNNYSCPASEGYYGTETDCDKFYLCEKSIASLYKCSTGLQFNSYATWGQDPCADEKVIRCSTLVIENRPEPKFSAEIITKEIPNYECVSREGYFKLDKECDKFIKCEKSIASSYKCLSGLQFNSEAVWGEDPCASENIIGCKVVLQPKTDPDPKFSATIIKILHDFTCPINNGYLDSKNKCEEFIKCENSVALLYKCLPGLQFNRRSSWGEDPCASEEIVRCKPVIEPKPLPAPKFSATLISKIVFEFTCPANNGFFESKNECEQFIKCENAIASLYRCLPGLQFNRRSSWGEDPCDREEVVQCKPVVVPIPKPQFSADLISRYLWDFTCTTNGYFKLGNECEKFVKCENSRASSYKCWSGLQFNPQASWGQDPCASESEVGCKAVVIPTTPKPSFSAILISSHLVDYRCLESNGYFSIDNNCERFVKCEMLVPSLYMCPKGLQFNRLARFGEDPCASASIVQCEVRTTTTTPAPVLSYTLVMLQVFGYTCTAANGYYAVKDNCGQFIECKNYIPSLYKCNSGLYFNRNALLGEDPCTLPSTAHCEQNPKKPPGPIDHHDSFQCPAKDGMYPLDKFECSKYIMCKMGRATIMPCPAGLVFNAELQTCDWPVNVPSCNPELFHGFSCPTPEKDDNNSPSDKIIKFKYEQSCTQYIACQHGHPRLLSCEKGLAFSEEHQGCLNYDTVPSCRNS